MATRFWVGGTGTWDASDTTHWASTSGGSNGQTVPSSSDTVTFDGNSGASAVITVNANVAASSVSLGTTGGNFTGTLDFATNNNSPTFGTFAFSGSGTRTLNGGTGTWTITGTSGTVADFSTVTGLTASLGSASFVLNGSSVARQFVGGGLTYGSLTISNNSTKGVIQFSGANTFASVTVGTGNSILMPQGTTTTITGALSVTGSSAAPCGLMSSGPFTNATTISVGSASTADWVAVLRVTKAGAGSITATNALDLGGNTSISISAPSGGGGTTVVGVIGG